MKKFCMLFIVLVVIMLSGCGKIEEKRNYYMKDFQSGLTYYNLTREEWDLVVECIENREDPKELDLNWDEIGVAYIMNEAVEMDNVTTWDNVKIQNW